MAASELVSPLSHHDLEYLNTLPDPRTPMNRSRSISPSPQSDNHSEVALLTNKLITAMNHQTGLDDTLINTRLELNASRERVHQLEAAVNEHSNMLASGDLLRRSEVDQRTDELASDLSTERKLRAKVEKGKRDIELELENLTTALFEEANEMVVAARKEKEDSDRRNEQLRAQLNETEILLASQQEQLADLKNVMQNMAVETEAMASEGAHSTAPSSPSALRDDEVVKAIRGLHTSTEDVSPAPPTTFTHLLSPVLRSDLQAYEDFRSLLETSRQSSPPSRGGSGNYGGLNFMAPPQGLQHGPSNASTSSLSSSTTWQSTPGTPNTPLSASSSVGSREVSYSIAPLKETRFYKRVLTEDIEPTLRLDTAPGLSWLNRRAVINSMCEGSLVVEPCPPHHPRLHYPACALCGENRKGEEYARRHRFRISESDNAQRYPLCAYCLNRLRSTCDFLGFLRMVKDGYWRADGEEAEGAAWEEATRLREHMFWSRIGGGVVPALVRTKDSPRNSMDHVQSARPRVHVEDGNVYPPLSYKNDPSEASDDRASIGPKSIISPDDNAKPRNKDHEGSEQLDGDSQPSLAANDEVEAQVQKGGQQSLATEKQPPRPSMPPREISDAESVRYSGVPGAFG